MRPHETGSTSCVKVVTISTTAGNTMPGDCDKYGKALLAASLLRPNLPCSVRYIGPLRTASIVVRVDYYSRSMAH